MEKITLPGGLPGLLRRGSPVFWPAYTELTKDEMTQFVVIYASGALCLVSNFEATREVFSEYLSLDLNDPTGRQHAIWWLEKQLCKFEASNYHLDMDVNINGLNWVECESKEFKFDEDEVCELGEFDMSNHEKIADGSYWRHVKALQIVCLHVAKEKGYI